MFSFTAYNTFWISYSSALLLEKVIDAYLALQVLQKSVTFSRRKAKNDNTNINFGSLCNKSTKINNTYCNIQLQLALTDAMGAPRI